MAKEERKDELLDHDADGIQEQAMLSDENPGEGWHQAGDSIDGKIFKLSSGSAVEMTEEEVESYRLSLRTTSAYSNLRTQRNELLMRSDWTQLPNADLTESQKEAWETYRQALRDLPETMTEDLTYTLPESPV